MELVTALNIVELKKTSLVWDQFKKVELKNGKKW